MNKLPRVQKFYNFTLRKYSNEDKIKDKNDYTMFKEYGVYKDGKFYFKNKNNSNIRLKIKTKFLPLTENEKQERIIHYNSIIQFYNNIFKTKEEKIKKKKNSITFHETLLLQKNLKDILNLKVPKIKRKVDFINRVNSNIEQDIVDENQKMKRHDKINIIKRLRNSYSFFELQKKENRNKEYKLIKLFEKKPIELKHNNSISRHRLNLIKSKSAREMEKILNDSFENS